MIQKYLWPSLIILLFILPSTSGYDDFPDESFSELSNKTPSYTIVPVPATIITDPGKTVNVDIYISGFGNIKNNKIRVFFPDDLLNPEDPGVIGTTIRCVSYDNKTKIPSFFDINVTLSDIVINLQECNFMHSTTYEEFQTPLIMSERKIFEKPPIYLSMNIAKNATPGDREVEIVFTYTDGIKWYQDKEKITIHVNNQVEENRQTLFILLALIGILLSFSSTSEKFGLILSSRSKKVLYIIIVISLTYILYLTYNSL